MPRKPNIQIEIWAKKNEKKKKNREEKRKNWQKEEKKIMETTREKFIELIAEGKQYF